MTYVEVSRRDTLSITPHKRGSALCGAVEGMCAPRGAGRMRYETTCLIAAKETLVQQCESTRLKGFVPETLCAIKYMVTKKIVYIMNLKQ